MGLRRYRSDLSGGASRFVLANLNSLGYVRLEGPPHRGSSRHALIALPSIPPFARTASGKNGLVSAHVGGPYRCHFIVSLRQCGQMSCFGRPPAPFSRYSGTWCFPHQGHRTMR